MANNKLLVLLLLVTFILRSCVDAYDAETEFREPVLVVEGMITTQVKRHLVKLSQSTPYAAAYSFSPERNALVYVKDNQDIVYPFREESPGHYYSIWNFRGITGNVYTLYIETSDGDIYHSSPQAIMPSVSPDTLYSRMITRQKWIPDNNGELVLTDVAGIEIIADITNYDNTPPKFRFDPQVLIQYVTVLEPSNPNSPLDFCTLKVGIEDMINLTVPETPVATGNVIQHELAFVPVERKYYPGMFLQHTRIDRRAVIVRQYSLNDEAWKFYQQLAEQIGSEGNLFDPIAVQIYGNISCVNKPDKLVLGFFEASGYHSETFVFPGEPLMPHRVFLKKVNDLDYLPTQTCSYEMHPPWWLY